MPATYTKKDGTQVKYDTKAYNELYRTRHKDEYYCETCQKKISNMSATRHLKTSFHTKRLPKEAEVKEPEVKTPEPEPVPEPKENPKESYMSVKDLKMKAKEMNLHGYSRMTKGQLEEFITKASIVPAGKPFEFEKAPVHEKHEAQSPPPAETKPKAKSKWNTFLSEYSKANNVSLKTAMGAKDAWEAYKTKA